MGRGLMLKRFPISPTTKRPLVSNWPEYSGEVSGAYGVVLTSDYLVVDVDPRNGGEEAEQELLLCGLLTPTRIVTTMQGGRHYYYKKDPAIKIRKQLSEYPGVDFLSVGCYVVGEGCTIKGVTYTGNGAEINEAPLALIQNITKTPKEPKETLAPHIELEELERLLAYLPKKYYENYDLWTQVGMILHHACEGSYEAMDAWDRWSQQSSKFKLGECSKKWVTFDNRKETTVTVGTLMAWALEEGYTPTVGDKLGSVEKPKGQKSCYDILSELTDWVYITDSKEFYNIIDGRTYDIDTMRMYFRRVIQKGDPISTILRSQQLTHADTKAYYPGESVFIETENGLAVNKWTPPLIKEGNNEVTFFTDHLHWLLGDDWLHVRDWMAWIIQKPRERLTWALLITGKYGTGKSYAADLLRKLIGIQNASYPSNEGIHEKYTGWMAEKQLVIINELMSVGRRDLVDKLKQLITDEYIPVRHMHKEERYIKATAAMIFISNYDNPIVLDRGDRRFGVFKTFRSPKSKEYYTKLWQWTDSNLGSIKNYLSRIDLSKFDPRNPPMTFAKEVLIKDSDYDEYAMDIDVWVQENKYNLFCLSEISAMVNQNNENFEYVDNRKLSSILRNKYQFLRRLRVKGVIQKFYCRYDKVEEFIKLSNTKLINLWKQEHLVESSI